MPGCFSLLMQRLAQRHNKPFENAPQETDSSIHGKPTISPHHNDDDGSLPPPYPAYTPGIKTLWSSSESTCDILFLHGPVADLETTWKAPGAIEPWPMTLLPPLVPTARVLTFAYNEYEVYWPHVILQEFILDRAGDLLSSLSTYRENDRTNERPIAFVCHGLGGLVCKDVLVNSSTHSEPTLRNIFLSTRGVIFLGTPFNGSGLASWLQSVSDSVGLNEQGYFDSINFLIKSSNLILDQNLGHLGIIKEKRVQMGLSPIEFTSFNGGLSLDFDSLIPKESATPPRCPSVGIHLNQVDMTKITNADNPLFKAIGEKLRRWISNADAKIIYHGSSSLAQPSNAHQEGDGNHQYNLFGYGTQKIVDGHYFKAGGDQNFM